VGLRKENRERSLLLGIKEREKGGLSLSIEGEFLISMGERLGGHGLDERGREGPFLSGGGGKGENFDRKGRKETTTYMRRGGRKEKRDTPDCRSLQYQKKKKRKRKEKKKSKKKKHRKKKRGEKNNTTGLHLQ